MRSTLRFSFSSFRRRRPRPARATRTAACRPTSRRSRSRPTACAAPSPAAFFAPPAPPAETAPAATDAAAAAAAGYEELAPYALRFLEPPAFDLVRESDGRAVFSGRAALTYKFLRHPDAPIVWGVGAYSVHIRPVLVAWFATGDRTYRDWIVRSCDNTLGANPMGLSWIVGLGERTIRAPLHNSRYRPAGVVADGMQSEGPSARAGGYNYNETVYPEHRDDFAPLHEYADCHFAIAMDEGVVRNQVLAMAIFGTCLQAQWPIQLFGLCRKAGGGGLRYELEQCGSDAPQPPPAPGMVLQAPCRGPSTLVENEVDSSRMGETRCALPKRRPCGPRTLRI